MDKMFSYDKERLAQHPSVKSHVNVRPTARFRQDVESWSKVASEHLTPVEPHVGKWDFITPSLHEHEATAESERCMKCADAPCTKGCPTCVDIKSFIHAISKGDYYHAAKVIYSDNPLGATCGVLCATSKQCKKTCNMRYQVGGPIEIGRLQQFACEIFQQMQIPVIRDSHPEKSYDTKVALIGAGPASLACATFLSRMGYNDITIFEKHMCAGGLPTYSIPEFRIPFEQLYAPEVKMAKGMPGVKVEMGKELGKDFTLQSLTDKGYQCIFVGTGRAKAYPSPFADKLPEVYQYDEFLELVSRATRPITINAGEPKAELPKLHGHVLILGGGDVAYDTASTALRLGAERVTLGFREDFNHLPCCREELMHGFEDRLDLYANVTPMSASVAKEGPQLRVKMQVKDWTQKGGLFQHCKEPQAVEMACDHVIVCFGSRAEAQAFAPLELMPNGQIKINPETNGTSLAHVFAGGDCVPASNAIVEAVNDAKTAAWYMHKYMQELHKLTVPPVPVLPVMKTVIDNVDLSVEVCGLKFFNPFGLSSATPTGCVDQVARAFDMGWSFAVLKTITQEPCSNISPRIIRTPSHRKRGPNQGGFQNIELLTEKTVEYWVEGIKYLKKNYPKHVVIASIMAAAEKEMWEDIAVRVAAAGPDALELNLSCPHVGKKGFGMLAGQSPEMVKQITSWVRNAVDRKIPVFVKLTPNITHIYEIAAAAKEGGADGVTAINTVSGLSHVRSNAVPYPGVGSTQKTAYGGVSGNCVRPMALRAISMIRKHLPDFPILGVGGIDSAESALQMINCGASVIQITSAIQDQDYTIVDELINGLKALLYMKSRPDLKDWEGQMPPLGFKPSSCCTTSSSSSSTSTSCCCCSSTSASSSSSSSSTSVPTVASQMNLTIPFIAVVPELDLQAQVKAHVDESECIRCGKCYLSCNDTGYCAIKFDPVTHLPEITDECMGCGLCQSVCPANCITYKLKTAPHKPKRGIRKPGDMVLPFDENQH